MSRCQQQEVYDAQRPVTSGRTLDRDQCQAFLDDFTEHPWWIARYPKVKRIQVVPAPAGTNPCGGWDPNLSEGVLQLKPHTPLRTLLHEAAHAFDHASDGNLAHGPSFCRIYLELVYLHMGGDAYQELKDGFDHEGVQYG